MMVILDSAGDASWMHMQVNEIYKKDSKYCIYKITNVPILENKSF